jgi:hypothetical protein
VLDSSALWGKGSVEGDEKFPHDRGEGEFGWFACLGETLIKGSQDVIATRGGEGGHVEATAEMTTAAEDIAFTPHGAAVAVKGSEAGEGCDLSAIELTQLGHSRQEQAGGPRAHPDKSGELLRFCAEDLILGNETFDARINERDLLAQLSDECSLQRTQLSIAELEETVLLGREHVTQVAALPIQLA